MLYPEFVTYKIAELLHEIGDFDKPCPAWYNWKENIKLCELHWEWDDPYRHASKVAPLWQQVIDWLMEKHQIYITIGVDGTCEPKFYFTVSRFIGNPKDLTEREWYWDETIKNEDLLYRTYQEAREEAILTALNLIKK